MRWAELPHAPAAGAVLGLLTEFPESGARLLNFGPEDDKPFRLIVLRSGDTVLGYVNRCAHFGVPLAAREDQLIFKPNLSLSCNVHYARYRWSDGACEFGDCDGEGLMTVPLTIVDGQVSIA